MGKITINQDSLKEQKKWTRFKIKEGNNIFRFLPPFNEAANGYAYKKHIIIWGLKDPSSNKVRAFGSSYAAEKTCPIYEYTDALFKKLEVISKKLEAKGLTPEQIKEETSALYKLAKELKPRSVFAWNAVDKSGTVGLVELKKTAQDDLKKAMTEYIADYNQDPTSVNSAEDDSGVWFNVERTGQGFKTEYSVKKVQMSTKNNGKITYQDDQSPLPENVVENWKKSAYDLQTIYPYKTYNELKEILMYNMPNFIEICPDALIPGFEPLQPEEKESNENTKKTLSKTNKVLIKLDDNDNSPMDDEDDALSPGSDPISMRSSTVKTADSISKTVISQRVVSTSDPVKDQSQVSKYRSSPSSASSNEDVFAMADNILNGN